ncbi:uncharacterized protein LOC118567312 [Fundulus heteroclitus]|uniref:uncharacterized protein LOC105924949 n=1 Tax=Fundulus heteroclitus TaxID=8078 RepID=UPI00165A59EF|nr:uncharacterized protein LOC105924949 [Fundulus heteroclitus]XP_036000601.1 uncharacterized protein LOC105924949 [Fundulus heteroclitus]XP_036008051.1 uncharacterized protein LOC118567312 [Fundulus heteroclitus]
MDSNMEKLDCVAKDILTAANIDMEALKMLSREELRDLFPGPDHFLRRKSIWDLCHPVEKASCSSSAAFIEVSNGTEFAATGTSSEGGDSKEEEKSGGTTYRTLTLPSPQYVIYTDSELENVKSYFFQLKRLGRGAECELSKELTCRLIRNTITNMMSAVRALHCEEKQYPSKEDLVAMAKRLVIYYPMLSDKLDIQRPWIEVFKRLQKRIHNVRSPKKSQGGTPARGKRKLQYLDADDTDDSTTSTILLSASSSSTPSTPEVHTSPATLPEVHSPSTSTPVKAKAVGHDSRMAQARHYRHLQEICRKNKQNQDDVSQLLDLEFEGRRQFIDSETLKEADRPGKILEAYSCFKNIDHVLEELRRIVAKDNVHYVKELKERWADYRTKLSFYGVYKKVLKPPVGLPADEQAIDLIISLADMFPSGYPAPKKMSSPSEALIHVLQPTEAPDVYLRRRPLATPFILVGEEDCFLCAGNAPVVSFGRSRLAESVLYVMAYYYAFHMTYPKCVSSVLLFLQTEVLGDAIHEKDQTAAFKRAKADWQTFLR